MDIQQSVESFSPLGQLSEIPILQRLGEGIEEGPDTALLKLLMPGFSPFMENGRDEPVGANANVTCPDGSPASTLGSSPQSGAGQG